jgi:hypothetical protein
MDNITACTKEQHFYVHFSLREVEFEMDDTFVPSKH